MVIWNYKYLKKKHNFTIYIELCTKSVGVGVNLALLKDNKHGDPHFLFFFLRGIRPMIVHNMKANL